MSFKRSMSLSASYAVVAGVLGGVSATFAPSAGAAPAPEIEYLYNVTVRRQYQYVNGTDALTYGRGICERVGGGQPYAAVMGDVKNDVLPNDEFAANYLVFYAVNLLCPAQIWQLRNSAAGYQLPAGG